MRAPTAILLGFSLIAIAYFASSTLDGFVTPARAQLDVEDFKMIGQGFDQLTRAIYGIEACRN